MEIIRKLGVDLLNKVYKVVQPSEILDLQSGCVVYPENLQQDLIDFLGIDSELSHIIVFDWLYRYGMRDILKNWEVPKINWNVTNMGDLNTIFMGCDVVNSLPHEEINTYMTTTRYNTTWVTSQASVNPESIWFEY